MKTPMCTACRLLLRVCIASALVTATAPTYALGHYLAPPFAPAATAIGTLGCATPGAVRACNGVLRATTSFLQSAVEDNATEMIAAQYAVANSGRRAVRDLARRILATRSKSNDQLLDLATRLGVPLPTYPTSSQLRTLSALRHQRGARFDSAYAEFMANAHTQELERFLRAAGSTSITPLVRRYAQDSLPVLQDTLRRVNRLLASRKEHTHLG